VTNVVLIHTDDTGRYIEPYGYGVSTPALQALAEEGVLFRNAFAAAPTCSPSRGALVTGMMPHSNGLTGLAHRGASLNDYGHHLVQFLDRHGYETVLSGQQHEAADGDRRTEALDRIGYRRVLGDPRPDGVASDRTAHERSNWDLANARKAAAFIREDHDEPYFLSLGLWNTHRPFPEPDAVDPDYVRPPTPLPDTAEIREEMAGYRMLAGVVDDCVETVMTALRASGDLEETVVVFTTDHGLPFPEMKMDLFDDGIGVSLIARPPDGQSRETAVDALASQIDLFPTLCEYLDLPSPSRLQGRSLLGLLTGDRESVRDEVFAELDSHGGSYLPKRCVRTSRYKLIRRYDPDTGDGNGDGDGTLDHGSRLPEHLSLDEAGRPRPAEALFDLQLDPNENENVVADPRYGDAYDDLAARLDGWMDATDDPLLDRDAPA